ncbi:hypothetical protein EDB84DRAFT_1563707 [Lactarius hengduanensis]|nr:hypothetical protein EDB84DRAFT_1563707 [Lactarius hengduanensis]
MATARDSEHGQMSSNSRGPSSSDIQEEGASIPSQNRPWTALDDEPQGGHQLRVDSSGQTIFLTQEYFGLKFFVTVASQATEKKTPSVPAKRQTARWGESLGAFILQPSTPLILSLYAKRKARQNTLIGTHEMIPVESQTVNVSPNTTSDPIRPSTTPIIQSPQSTTRLLEKLRSPLWPRSPRIPLDPTVTAGPETLSPPPDRLPSEMSTPIPPAADRRGVSPAESALHGTDEAIATINLSNKWEGALGRIKWVMDTVSPVAEYHPYAKMAYGLLFAIPKTLLEQFQRDDNIGTLLVAMHDAFDFANQEPFQSDRT